MDKAIKSRISVLLCTIAFLGIPGFSSAQSPMEIWFVSQYGSAGTATMIKGPDGTVVLYDEGGGAAAASKCKAILDAEGMSFIDYAIAGHYDSDHQGGLDDLVSMMGGTYSFGAFYDRGGTQTYTGSAIDASYYDLVNSSGKRSTVTLDGSSDISLGYGAKIQFMSVGAPDTADTIYIRGRYDVTTGISENNKSITGLVSFNSTYGAAGFDLYLGSDAEGTTELAVDDVVMDLGRSCDVLLVDHHGSYTYGISSPEFFGNMDPEVAVISVWDNAHGHPRVEVVENLQEVVEQLDQRIIRLMPGDTSDLSWAPETMDYCHTTGSDSIDGTVKITVSTDGLFYTVTGYGITESGLTDHPVDEYFITPTPTPAVDWNRSFEDWSTETHLEKWDIPSSFARQTSFSRDGNYAAVVVGYGDSVCLTQALPADAPRTMEFGVWMRLFPGGGAEGTEIDGRVAYHYVPALGGDPEDVYGNQVAGPTGWACSLLRVERGDDWTNEAISICFSAPAAGSEAVIVDAAYIRDYSVPSPTPTSSAHTPPPSATPTPFNGWFPSWAWREKITIPATGLESDLAGFPVFISLDSSRSQVFRSAQPGGGDVVFAPGDRSVKWPHEIEKYNLQTGSEELAVWVKVPQLSSQSDTVFYMYYGNPVTAAQQDPAGVWDSHFKGVWHLGEGEGSSAGDSTAAGNDGTANEGTGWTGEGWLDGAYSCDGSGDYFTVPDASGLKPTRITLEGWIRPAQIPFAVSYPGIFDSDYSYAYSFLGKDGDELSAYFHIGGSLKTLTTSGADLRENTWYYAVARYDGNEIGIFINGEERASLPVAGNLDTGGGKDLLLGFGRGGVSFWTGGLDELRLSDIARSDDWILACYRNQSSPGDFFGISPREGELTPTVSPTATAPPTPPPTPSPTLTPVSDWNKSFEDWVTETELDKWYFVESFARQTDNARHGDYAAVLCTTDDHAILSQTLPADAPRLMEFGVWHKMLENDGTRKFQVAYEYREGVGQPYHRLDGSLVVSSTEWAASTLRIERGEEWVGEIITITASSCPIGCEVAIIDAAWIRDYSVPSPSPTPSAIPTATPSAPPTSIPSPPPTATTTPEIILTPTPIPVPTSAYLVVDWDDYDGDGTSDIAVYDPATGEWDIQGVTEGLVWGGGAGDIPAPGDYDGDGTADLAYFDRFSGEWNIIRASGEEITTGVAWGNYGDIPVPGDYYGDSTADPTTWRPSDGIWRVRGVPVVQWGMSGDFPVPGDYDGDGTTDIAVVRPSNWIWYVRGIRNRFWGCSGAIVRPMDYDGDGTTDLAIWRPSVGVWYTRHLEGTTFYALRWGVVSLGDIPVVGDFDGDGLADPAVFRPVREGLWWINYSSQPVGSVAFSAQSTNSMVIGATSY